MRTLSLYIAITIMVALTVVIALAVISWFNAWITWGGKQLAGVTILQDSRILDMPDKYLIVLHVVNHGQSESFLGEIKLYNRYYIPLDDAQVIVIKGDVEKVGSSIHIGPYAEFCLLIPIYDKSLIPPYSYTASVYLYLASGRVYPVTLLIESSSTLPPSCQAGVRQP